MSRVLLVSIVSILLLSCVSTHNANNPPPAPSPLMVTVSVPALDEKTIRELALGGTFSVAVVNVSQQNVRVWNDNCSWGFENLSLEFCEADDIEAKMSRQIVKKAVNWLRNVPRVAELAPGESIMFTVKFNDKVWKDLDFLDKYVGKKIRMRVNYENGEDEYSQKKKVWTGALKTAFQEYEITKAK